MKHLHQRVCRFDHAYYQQKYSGSFDRNPMSGPVESHVSLL
jgi:hypothetical protein